VVNIQGTGWAAYRKKYIDLLGGSITLDSTLGKGTKIVFTIPIKE
jgi:signal transduction histidine kinase